MSTNKIKQDMANEVTPSEYNPLQILPAGVHPSPVVSQSTTDFLQFSQNKLQDAQLQNCLAASILIKKEANNIADTSEDSIKEYMSMAEGINNYYTNQVLSSGKTLKNYDMLVADVLSQQHSTIPLIAKMREDINNFDCNANNPSAQITLFIDDSNMEVNLLKNYNTSAKNLITAAKSIQTTQHVPTVMPKSSQ